MATYVAADACINHSLCSTNILHCSQCNIFILHCIQCINALTAAGAACYMQNIALAVPLNLP